MNTIQATHPGLLRTAITRALIGFLLLAALFFIPAGTWDYWQAWVYLAVVFIPMLFVLVYLLTKAPDLLERRMKLREKETAQKWIVYLSFIPFVLVFVLPGFDRRFGWSDLPVLWVILSDVIIVLGYGLVFLVFRENRYASRVVEVEQEQTVISSGPYAIVRHPMYSGMFLFYCFTPLALGSVWTMLVDFLFIVFFVTRIRSEEKTLLRDLKGYLQYTQKTRYRLIPGIW
jgi:protein-S-isoprenylcysteine O-methyltransferase Ste14